MKALKALVISMGLLIVVGLGLVGFGLYRNAHLTPPMAPAPMPAALPAPPPGPAPPAPPGRTESFTASLPLAAGERVEEMTATADRVVLRLAGGAGQRLVVLDPRNGQITGTVALTPAR